VLEVFPLEQLLLVNELDNTLAKIVTEKKSHLLSAPTSKEKDLWNEALLSALNSLLFGSSDSLMKRLQHLDQQLTASERTRPTRGITFSNPEDAQHLGVPVPTNRRRPKGNINSAKAQEVFYTMIKEV